MSKQFEIELYSVSGASAIKMEVGQFMKYCVVEQALNRLPHASISLVEGRTHLGEFNLSTDKRLQPGAVLQIKVKNYEKSSTNPLFTGVITSLTLHESHEGPEVRVEASHQAIRMTKQRNYRVFPPNTTDKKAVKGILDAWAADGVKPIIDSVAPKLGAVPYPNLVQFNCTDWDFICWRAAVTGSVVSFVKEKIAVVVPALKPSPAKKLVYDQDELLNMEIRLDGNNFLKAATGLSSDIKPATSEAMKSAGKVVKLEAGKVDQAALALTMGTDDWQFTQPVPGEEKELELFASAHLMRSDLALTQGRIRIFGRDDLVPGDTLTLQKFGPLAKDNVYLSGVKHQFDQMGWTTDLQFGLSKQWYQEQRKLAPEPALGLLPPATGMQLAEVLEVKEKPDKDARVKVQLLTQTVPPIAKQKAPKDVFWARIATFYAGAKHGAWFRPDKGDLVVLGFINDDPRHPVILGSMYRTPKDLSLKLEAENKIKGLVFTNGTGISVDDKDGIVTISTDLKGPAQFILLDQKKGKVIIGNGTDHQITLEESALSIKTSGNLSLKADGDISIEAGGKLTVKGAQVELL